MNKRLYIFLTLITLVYLKISSQKQIINEERIFLGYFNQTRITKRFGVWSDVHYRQTDRFTNRPLQDLGRVALSLYLTDNFRIMAGYCLAYNFPESGLRSGKIEHRPWQQLFLKQEYNGVQSIQLLRLEQRYIQVVVNDVARNEYSYTNRLRYSYLLLIPFSKTGIVPKKIFAVLNNEVFFNFGKTITYNVFDQNRFFAGIGYQINKHNSIHLGYMNVFQQTSSGSKFINSNCIRAFYYHNLDFRKEKS
ncbi:MAG: DUF2490 domain-containing protein [Bacteroidia bacterium]|nr:DUF2490 domain-containing protein [Bacteroidia bacterium]